MSAFDLGPPVRTGRRFSDIAIRIGCIATTLFAMACNSPDEIVGQHELALDVDYNGNRLLLKLPFSCVEYEVDWGGSMEVTAKPSPYLYHTLPDDSALAIGTPQICAGRFADTATGRIQRPLDEPYSGSILIPPTAWMDDIKRPTVLKQWASAQAMKSAPSGLIVRSASVSPTAARGRSNLSRDAWSSTPAQLRRNSGGDMCGVAFVFASSTRPDGFEETQFRGVYRSTKRSNFANHPSFGAGGIAATPVIFNGVLPERSRQNPNTLSEQMNRAKNIIPVKFYEDKGWQLDQHSGDKGIYISYRLSGRQHRLYQTFTMGKHELPLTWSRQLWLEEEAILLTPTGTCRQWQADR